MMMFTYHKAEIICISATKNAECHSLERVVFVLVCTCLKLFLTQDETEIDCISLLDLYVQYVLTLTEQLCRCKEIGQDCSQLATWFVGC